MNAQSFYLIFNLSHQYPILDSLMIFITNYFVYLTFLFMIFLNFKGEIVKNRKAFILTVLAIPISILLIKVIHLIYAEQRPFVTFNFIPLTDNTPDLSFPSRHATIMAAISFAYFYFKSKWTNLFLFLMLIVGLSRVYVGVHYPIDVLSGFIVGGISTIISIKLIKLIKLRFFR